MTLKTIWKENSMDLKAKYLLETCSDPIGFLNQLRQTTEPIGGGIVYSEDGELVEYEVAIEAIKKANDAFIEKACDFFEENIEEEDCKIGSSEWTELRAEYKSLDSFIRAFVKYMKGE